MIQWGSHVRSTPATAPVRARPGVKVDIDVEAFSHWVYRDQMADRAARSGLFEAEMIADRQRVFHHSADGVVAVAKRGALGCAVDGGGFASGAVHPDAEAAHAVVMGLRRGIGAQLITFARLGARPELPPVISPLEPVWRDGTPDRDADGLPKPRSFKVVYDPKAKRPLFCPIEPRYPAAMMAVALSEYREWWQGLSALAEHFQRHPERLTLYRLTGPAAPALPVPQSQSKSD